MADNSEPPTPPDFSFAPTPITMSLDQFWGFISSATPEQRAMVERYFGGTATPTPQQTLTGMTPADSPLGTPQSSRSGTSRRRRASGGGGGCCVIVHMVRHHHGRPPISLMENMPQSLPRTPWASCTPSQDCQYTMRSGDVVMDDIGKEIHAHIQ